MMMMKHMKRNTQDKYDNDQDKRRNGKMDEYMKRLMKIKTIEE